jgi:uncharacterized protein (DUF1697 family)
MDRYLSSAKSEYVSPFEALTEAIFLSRIMKEITGRESSVIIFNDSQSSQALARNPVHHKRTKHIDVKYHFVREQLQAGVIVLKYLNKNEMLADALTKPLPKEKF